MQDKLSQITAKRMTVEDVRPGVIGYHVLVRAENTKVHEVHFLSVPFVYGRHNSLWAFIAANDFAKIHGVKDMGQYVTSLQDEGVVPNDYNNHLTFKTREDAEAYAAYCRAVDMPSCRTLVNVLNPIGRNL